MASLSARNSGRAHPPRSNPPLRSSSGPPSPCITPSTETFVMVVSFMLAVPFSLGLVVVRFDRTAAPISSSAAGEGLQRRLRLQALEDVETAADEHSTTGAPNIRDDF